MKRVFFFCGFFLLSGSSSMYSIQVIAHRGASGHALENSFEAFEKAIELGADVIELDVRKCKTGELVVMHDARLDPTTSGCGYLKDVSCDELKRIALRNGEQIPFLKDVLDAFIGRTTFYIEIKEEDIAAQLASVLKSYLSQGHAAVQFMVASFNHFELETFKRLCPEVQIIANAGVLPLGYGTMFEESNPNIVSLYYEFVTQKFVDDLHDRGMQVFVFSVDENTDIKRMKQLGVDGIVSNFPERITS